MHVCLHSWQRGSTRADHLEFFVFRAQVCFFFVCCMSEGVTSGIWLCQRPCGLLRGAPFPETCDLSVPNGFWQVTEVLRIYPKWNKILCLGVNYCIKHVRRIWPGSGLWISQGVSCKGWSRICVCAASASDGHGGKASPPSQSGGVIF